MQARNPNLSDREQGLYHKYDVDLPPEHAHCELFILDLTHDPYAAAALEIYEGRTPHHGYHVERTDGSSAPGKKHENCIYVVIDLSCDPKAADIMTAYGKACAESFPKLARDLELLATQGKEVERE